MGRLTEVDNVVYPLESFTMTFQWIRAVFSAQPNDTLRAFLFAAVPLAFLLGLMLFQLGRAIPEAETARTESNASFRTVQVIGTVFAAIRDAERGQRGFLITDRDVYLTPYDDAKQSLPRLIAELQDATREIPEQQKLMLKFQADVTTKMNELASTLAAMRQNGFESARALVQNDLGRSSMDAISSDLAAIGDAAQAHLSARLSRTRDAERRTMEIFVIGSLLSVAAFIGGAVLLDMAL